MGDYCNSTGGEVAEQRQKEEGTGKAKIASTHQE